MTNWFFNSVEIGIVINAKFPVYASVKYTFPETCLAMTNILISSRDNS